MLARIVVAAVLALICHFLPLEGIAEKVQELLGDVQKTLYEQAKAFRDERTTEVHNMD